MRSVPVGLKLEPALSGWLAEVARAITELQMPTQPHPVFAVAVASLPPASSYQNCVVDLTDLNTLGKSDGVNWRRVDTGAIVA